MFRRVDVLGQQQEGRRAEPVADAVAAQPHDRLVREVEQGERGVFAPDHIGAYCDDAIDFLRRRLGLGAVSPA